MQLKYVNEKTNDDDKWRKQMRQQKRTTNDENECDNSECGDSECDELILTPIEYVQQHEDIVLC